jgi:hypothetical protein
MLEAMLVLRSRLEALGGRSVRTGQQIVAHLCTLLPTATLWRYQRRTIGDATPPQYEEQELDSLLADLDRG